MCWLFIWFFIFSGEISNSQGFFLMIFNSFFLFSGYFSDFHGFLTLRWFFSHIFIVFLSFLGHSFKFRSFFRINQYFLANFSEIHLSQNVFEMIAWIAENSYDSPFISRLNNAHCCSKSLLEPSNFEQRNQSKNNSFSSYHLHNPIEKWYRHQCKPNNKHAPPTRQTAEAEKIKWTGWGN